MSYYESPSRNEDLNFSDEVAEVTPAGRGMRSVQLLVVDFTSLENWEGGAGKPQQ